MKTCSHCNQTKPLDEFYLNRISTDGKDHYCKACRKIRNREYYVAKIKNNPERLAMMRERMARYRARQKGIPTTETKGESG